jgi:hypothetical protein
MISMKVKFSNLFSKQSNLVQKDSNLIEMHESVKAGSKDERDEILMICLS